MEIIKTLSDGTYAIKCAFCEGTGTESVPANMDDDDDIDWTCSVCGGKGLIIERGPLDLLIKCARCNGKGKEYAGAYYLGETCAVCEGKGYIKIKDTFGPDIWTMLHPRINKIARQPIEAKNYSDAVVNCVKDLNIELKGFYRKKTGKELDGSALAGSLLSIDKPLLHIADLETESGRNRQKGLIQIIQGLFVGIRNPVFHDQNIGYSYCVHSLFILSFIHNELDYSELRSDEIEEDTVT